MNANNLLSILESFSSSPILKLSIEWSLFEKVNGRKLYNKLIRENVQNKFGVYLWGNPKTDEIYYIGMAGKIKTDGTLSNHTLQQRLQAPRGRDKKTKKDIQTNDFVKEFMKRNKILSLDFHVAYSKDDIPPSYVEAVLLYEYFKENTIVSLQQINLEDNSRVYYDGTYKIISEESITTKIECSLSDGQGSNPTYVLTINKSDKKGICTGNNEPEFSIEKK